jgi:hypothetical protein
MRATTTTTVSESAIQAASLSQLAKRFAMIKNDGFHQDKVRKSMRPPTTNKNSQRRILRS